VGELVRFDPAFITCTYGAGGSTQDSTLDVLGRVLEAHKGMPVASHLTCVGATREELQAYIQRALDLGVSYIVALRGDPPKGETEFKPTPGGLQYGNELVAMIRENFPEVGTIVGGYPETHQEAADPDTDLDYLKKKVEAGGDVVVTQLFYDNDTFYRFRDRYEAAGIQAPLVPGILPITNFKQIKRIMKLCGATMPEKLSARFEAHGDDTDAMFDVGVYWAASQTEDLLANGVPGVHFYVLNKSRAAARICQALALGT